MKMRAPCRHNQSTWRRYLNRENIARSLLPPMIPRARKAIDRLTRLNWMRKRWEWLGIIKKEKRVYRRATSNDDTNQQPRNVHRRPRPFHFEERERNDHWPIRFGRDYRKTTRPHNTTCLQISRGRRNGQERWNESEITWNRDLISPNNSRVQFRKYHRNDDDTILHPN